MNLHCMPSIQQLALTKISVVLCNNRDIKEILERNRYYDSYGFELDKLAGGHDHWPRLNRSRYPKYALNYPLPHHDINEGLLEQIREKVRSMISSLNLAQCLGKKILNFIPCIIVEIEKWEEDHCEIFPENFDAQVYFCWKSVGTIDRERTTQNLFNHGNLSVVTRFSLACWYCMEFCLSSLFKKIRDTSEYNLILKYASECPLHYWTDHLNGIPEKMTFFPSALYITNLSALRCFYNKCADEDKKKAFLDDVLSKQWKNIDVAQFCVRELCRNGREQLSSVQCRNILRCFLNWPLQSLFLDKSEHLLINVDVLGIQDLLEVIHKFILKLHSEDIDYLNLLKEFWKQIPSHHKNSLMNSPRFKLLQIALQATHISEVPPPFNFWRTEDFWRTKDFGRTEDFLLSH